eukprot:scaffold67454_cov44-Cyclotella_meneghiniana.AAC.3
MAQGRRCGGSKILVNVSIVGGGRYVNASAFGRQFIIVWRGFHCRRNIKINSTALTWFDGSQWDESAPQH